MNDDALLGASLLELADPGGSPLSGDPDLAGRDVHVAEAAAQTPLLARLRALHQRCEGGAGVLATDALSVVARGASTARFGLGLLPPRDMMVLLVGTAADVELVTIDGRRIRHGREAHLVLGHPLAAWGEMVVQLALSDPLGCPEYASASDTVTLLPLLLQLIVSERRVDLETCVAPLHAEITAAATRRGARPPSQRAVRRQLATLTALLEELGALEWQPEASRLGTARRTMLGAFGWMLVQTDVDGPSPELERMLTDRGYLTSADGWISPADVPITVSAN